MKTEPLLVYLISQPYRSRKTFAAQSILQSYELIGIRDITLHNSDVNKVALLGFAGGIPIGISSGKDNFPKR
jgi:hypothetical protein